MAKSFKNNPALQFISTEDYPVEETTTPQPKKAEQPPEGYKVNPMYIEKRTERVQLVFKPSVLKKAKQAAERDGVSLNEYIHRLIENKED